MCISHQHRSVLVPLRTDAFEPARQKADLLARLLQDLGQIDNQGVSFILLNHLSIDLKCLSGLQSNFKGTEVDQHEYNKTYIVSFPTGLLKLLILNLVKSERSIETARVVTFNPTTSQLQPTVEGERKSGGIRLVFVTHAAQPPSPYAEPELKVDFQSPEMPATANSTKQVTSVRAICDRQSGPQEKITTRSIPFRLPRKSQAYKRRSIQSFINRVIRTGNFHYERF